MRGNAPSCASTAVLCRAATNATEAWAVRTTFRGPACVASHNSISVPPWASRQWRVRMKPLSSVTGCRTPKAGCGVRTVLAKSTLPRPSILDETTVSTCMLAGGASRDTVGMALLPIPPRPAHLSSGYRSLRKCSPAVHGDRMRLLHSRNQHAMWRSPMLGSVCAPSFLASPHLAISAFAAMRPGDLRQSLIKSTLLFLKLNFIIQRICSPKPSHNRS